MAKHRMLAVQMRCRAHYITQVSALTTSYPFLRSLRPTGNKELAPVRARPRVRHAQGPLVLMFQAGYNLILKLASVDRLAASSRPCRVASLDHKAFDDAVEDDVVVLPRLSKLGEVAACLQRKN